MHPVATALTLASSLKSNSSREDFDAPDAEPVLTHEERRFLVRGGIGLGMVGLAGVAGLVIRSQIRKAARNQVVTAAFEGKPHAQVALKLFSAFKGGNRFGWGTKEEVVRHLIRMEVTSWQFMAKVVAAYKLASKGGKFWTDLNSELVPTEVNEIMAILRTKPKREGGTIEPNVIHESRAQRIKAGIEYEDDWGIPWTDLGALNAVFSELETAADWEGLKAAYFSLYSTELSIALDDELWDWELDWKAAVELNTGIKF